MIVDKLSCLCHSTVMKLSPVLLCLVAASVMPTATAFAQTAESAPRPFAVKMTSSATPVSHGDVRYPTAAAMRGLDGACTVRFDVTQTGAASDVEVLSCSSDHFRTEAAALAGSLKFNAAARTDATMNISWTFTRPDAAVATASLQ
jgi:TonB family protein